MITIIFNNNCECNGKITARISQLFNQVRTEIRVLMLVATEKAPIKHRVNNCVIMVKYLIIPMVLYRLDFIKIHNSYRKNQAVKKVKSFLLVGNKLDTGIQFKNIVLVDTKADTNLNVRNKYAPKTNLLMRTNLIIGHVMREFFDPIKKGNYLTDLANFSRQAFLTQAEKLLSSFFACLSICSSKSSSKRIILEVLLERSKLLFLFSACIGLYQYDRLIANGLYHINYKLLKKQSPEVLATLSRDLTQPLYEVMIMANRYDSAHLRAEQPKLYKFYDHSTTQVVQSIAPTECQARNNLGKQSLIFIARKPINPVFNHVNNWGYAHA